MKRQQTVDTVYIYIYIVSFNEMKLCERSNETMYFSRV